MADFETNSDIVFDPEYWGDLEEFDPSSTRLKHPDASSPAAVREAIVHIGTAWDQMLSGGAVTDPILDGSQFDPNDLDLSRNAHYQKPGTVLLIGIEVVTNSTRRAVRTDAVDLNLLSERSVEFMREFQVHRRRAKVAEAVIEFSSPEADKLYRREVSMLVMAQSVGGSSVPLRPTRTRKPTSKGTQVIILPAKAPNEGLPIVGQSYATYDRSGNVTAIRRLATADIIRHRVTGDLKRHLIKR